jgi:hypothetical protein
MNEGGMAGSAAGFSNRSSSREPADGGASSSSIYIQWWINQSFADSNNHRLQLKAHVTAGKSWLEAVLTEALVRHGAEHPLLLLGLSLAYGIVVDRFV